MIEEAAVSAQKICDIMDNEDDNSDHYDNIPTAQKVEENLKRAFRNEGGETSGKSLEKEKSQETKKSEETQETSSVPSSKKIGKRTKVTDKRVPRAGDKEDGCARSRAIMRSRSSSYSNSRSRSSSRGRKRSFSSEGSSLSSSSSSDNDDEDDDDISIENDDEETSSQKSVKKSKRSDQVGKVDANIVEKPVMKVI